MKLKILSWNIWYDGHFDEISRFLASSGADIIGLQEVVSDDKTRDIIGYLTKLGYQHVFSPVLKLKEDGRTIGNAVFSRREITKSKTHVLSEQEKRLAIEADIRAGNATISVFSTHLLHTHQRPSEIQDAQVNSLIKVLPPAYVVVVGDFNATPDSAVIQKMQKVLVDADPAQTPTWSVYPEGCPACNPQTIDTRLDYIFTSKDIKTSLFKVGTSNGSDHLPISVDIEV